jgi:hypothetical protein
LRVPVHVTLVAFKLGEACEGRYVHSGEGEEDPEGCVVSCSSQGTTKKLTFPLPVERVFRRLVPPPASEPEEVEVVRCQAD